MDRPRIEFHPEAIEEARAARPWYATRSQTAADGFMAELDIAVERIIEALDRWAIYLHETRRYLMHRYPYVLLYREMPGTVQAIAVAHARRRPGYWEQRIVE